MKFKVALALMGIILLAAALLPYFYISNKASELQSNPAYRSLLAIEASHNGDVSYNHAAATAITSAVAHPGPNGATVYAKEDVSGQCWGVLIPAHGMATVPQKATHNYCVPG